MGRSLSPIVRRELENLDKDSDSRKSAMKALKSYVKDLDSEAIPIFIAQVYETKQTGISPGEHTISLYEVLARVHGPKIVPQIGNIMSSIVKTLSLSGGSFALHQACSKVVPAIARYGIDPATSVDGKRSIIHSLCQPLSDCLLDSQENLSSGAALCLQTLVASDNWRFAANEMVNEVCQRVAGALEKHSHINSHMSLISTLAKHSSQIVEAYVGLLIQSGLTILDNGFVEANSQKQLSAIHMVCSLMRFLDPRSILSELELVIKEMEKCQHDRMPFVSAAALEAQQIAKRICAEKGTIMVTRARTPHRERKGSPRCNALLIPASPESHSLVPSLGYDCFLESPKWLNESPRSVGCDRGSVNRKVWQRFENGGLDVSLKDGIFSELTEGSHVMNSEYDEFSHNRGSYFENFTGFIQESDENGSTRSRTPSPAKSSACVNADGTIFTTPQKLICSFKNLDDHEDSGFDKQTEMIRSSKFAATPSLSPKQNGSSQDILSNNRGDKKLSSGCVQFHGCSESVSSTDGVLTCQDPLLPKDIATGSRHQLETRVDGEKNQFRYAYKLVCCVFVALFAAFLYLVTIVDGNDLHVVPT